jgi:uncharacterized membrane protein YuzA (DUF378 family)
MNAGEVSDDIQADSLVLAALLHASVGTLGWWSLACSVLAAVALLLGAASTLVHLIWSAVLLAGIGERYMLFRLTLDQRLFQQLGERRMPSLSALDAGLERLGLRRAQPRVWTDRIRGTLSLFRWHLRTVVLQTVLMWVAFGWHLTLRY